ncbi:MAG: rRNA maturation RNase YbeY [Candidatus Portnoybacteria bacterium CG10_big_fil_rev_8_21_14_0_10_38_18]|uniref:Endoribonuclease YbeY n=1 Tax=Candidatus Portnoybacteria bacterium CG10_big_fil_rev_8_21_14_0_10_38_18 TaxID=1974813 RepID=A0A2M8KCZ8_9BACT|nr:MAG: rRNA maturation RNase YbeY [Candidatus Portnoybacteria bacterium CG10_big_fil_rev_8_21_14_0_10_38_18]
MKGINVEINNLTRVRIDNRFFEKTVTKLAKLLKIKLPEISLVFLNDKEMKNLNRKYRKRNRLTDVLSFDYGEILICLPQAKRQAKLLNHSLKDELVILLIHGILHLVGYNDETKKDYNKMSKKQKALWQKITS